VYAFSPRALEYMTPNERLDFPDLIRRLLSAGEVVRAYRSDCYWLDIGRHDDYEQALEEFERMKHRLVPDEPFGERRAHEDRRGDPERREQGDRRMLGDERRIGERRSPLPASDGRPLGVDHPPAVRRAPSD
jgi:NDP-sugar pyrophosphorylase family protein